MKFSFKKICINAPFPTCQEGHIQQTFLVNEYKDDLYARVFGIITGNEWFINVSCDLIGVPEEVREKVQSEMRKYYAKPNLNLVIGVTHTHYANSIHDLKYQEFFTKTLLEGLKSMVYEEYDNVTTSYRRVHATPVGKSRITGYETNLEFLSAINIYAGEKTLLSIIIHNVHPTTLEATVPFFSAEYPGQLMKKLEEAHPFTNFTFLQGAAGDMSSRFVRKDKSYEEMLRLSQNIYEETEKLLKMPEVRKPLKCDYKEERFTVEHDFSPVDLSKVRDKLTDRELETIEYGKIMRERYEKEGHFIKEAVISRIDLGSVKLVFSGNELFSDFMKNMNLDERMLVAYTNADWAYVVPRDFTYITYELFYDTWSKASKDKLYNLLETL